MHQQPDAGRSAADIGSVTARRDLSCQGPGFDVRRGRSFQEPQPLDLLLTTIFTSTAYTCNRTHFAPPHPRNHQSAGPADPISVALLFIRSVCQIPKQTKNWHG